MNSEVEYYKVYLAPDYWVLSGYYKGLLWAALLVPIAIMFAYANKQGYVRSVNDKELREIALF